MGYVLHFNPVCSCEVYKLYIFDMNLILVNVYY